MVPNVISHRYVLNAGLNMFDRLNEISKKNDDEANNEDEDEVDDEALFFLWAKASLSNSFLFDSDCAFIDKQ